MLFTNGHDLRNAVLNAPIGICILDAATLTAEIVNDKFLEVAGRPYEVIFGKFYWDAFAEARPYYEAALSGVVQTGEAYHADEVELMLIRHGKEEMVFVTFVYSPVKDETGKVTKVAVWVLENTRQVTERQKVEAAHAAIQQERDRLKRFFMQAPAGICILDGPDLVFELVNPAYQEILPGRQLLNRPIFEALPELVGQPLQDVLLNVYRTGEPYEVHDLLIPIATHEGGPTRDRYFSFNYLARLDETGKVDGILTFVFEVTTMVTAQQVQLALNNELGAANEELAALNEELALTQQELLKKNTDLINSESQARFMLNAIPQQIWTANPDGALEYVNDVVCEDFGYSAAEIVGYGWQKFIHPDDLPACLKKWNASLKSGREYVVEFRLLFSDGTYKWHLSRALPFIENGRIVLWLGTNTDINFQKENEKRKDEFLSVASHELKTPVTSLKASLQLLERMKHNPLPAMFPKLIDQSNRSIDKITALIDELLHTSRMNEGQLSLTKATFTLAEMLELCCNHVRVGGKYELIVQGDKNLKVYADEHRIDQVVVNFVNNAVKYAPDSLKIYLIIEKIGDNAKVSVKDTGPGITPDKIPFLFSRYYRADYSGIQYSGLGLGLYICAEIVKRHGGDIGVDSKLGKGSTFWFTLPLTGEN